MTAPLEPIPCSLWLSPSPNDPPALVSELERSHLSMVESLAQDTMVPLQVLLTAPTRPQSRVSVRYMLRPMPSRTRPDMESLLQGLSYMRRTHPAIHALVCSSTREYHPWFLCDAIEMTADSDCSRT
ncbi:hypothetical protein SEA_JACOREN57_41 [Mycobacterium phage JacoRen57]|nr:hypothetical protein SEA_JACOREN57_41 [Mycobacterium phage JacoRen57]